MDKLCCFTWLTIEIRTRVSVSCVLTMNVNRTLQALAMKNPRTWLRVYKARNRRKFRPKLSRHFLGSCTFCHGTFRRHPVLRNDNRSAAAVAGAAGTAAAVCVVVGDAYWSYLANISTCVSEWVSAQPPTRSVLNFSRNARKLSSLLFDSGNAVPTETNGPTGT